MKKKIISVSLLCTILFTGAFSQTEKFDIASFVAPQGWQRFDNNGSIAFMDSKTENGLKSFCQIILYPSLASTGKADKNFKTAWQNLVTIPAKSNAKPVTQTEKTPEGWTVITGTANILNQGLAFKTIVSSITGFGKNMNIQVNTAGGDYVKILEKFFNDLDLDSKTVVVNNQTNMNGTISMKDYEFVAPENWQVQNKNDHISILNPQSGCVIRILSPQPSSGNLEQDVKAVFEMMYIGWQFQRAGERQYDLSRGFLPKGLEYCMMEAPMSMTGTDGRYHLEEGAALLVKANNQNVIISVRHNSSTLAHDDCWKKYETWRRFFNSFTVKNATIPKPAGEDNSKRIVGVWKVTGHGVVAGEYIFAANGNYQLGGAIGSSTTTADYNYEYLHLTSYSFQGDGTYSIAGNELTLRKRGTNPEQVLIRFEQVNHGGTGWKDRFYILKKSVDDGKEYEACYEKKDND